ncbi:TnsA endonuclease C-terminal domain-containing protein [Desulfovibrio gilichinskyi]|uniref:TnsA endonuclease C terminal n=1 Tax=Desulfovibrio gilichinskyi TaxID=1519643 RepID=A0A1X7EIM2_9BACT|nr:TnsA endonuclease C-terminal domain-containing protein [Desulfovibrio gilichinskyi]SMF34577.1 TnsA endonuclease C terminal [Desulfovibrio gilichinskyi]
MAKIKSEKIELKFQRWIKEGRGTGHGHEYIPWIKVRDISSRGRSHRIYGFKSQRTHHLLSDLELAIFLSLEWGEHTVDIREQFPLRREETLELAAEARIDHPSFCGTPHYMTSDFLVNTKRDSLPKFVIQAKYTKDFSDPRTVEKLELERRYWVTKQIPWFLITELEISQAVFSNIEWLYPSQGDEISAKTLVKQAENYAYCFEQEPDSKIIDITKSLDVAYQLPKGESLLELRQLLAKRFFVFDISKSYLKLRANELEMADFDMLLEAVNV